MISKCKIKYYSYYNIIYTRQLYSSLQRFKRGNNDIVVTRKSILRD